MPAVAFDSALCSVDDLVDVLARAERVCGVGDRPFATDAPEH